ncbi:hypothetical protein C5Z26_07405 [Lactobacillus sp. CBA3606]|uniref:DUF1398 family protein n=1 Tax=unclassified Lactobacillus TaxID=2620435 RepID=UPI000CFD7685|nr:MULTISPECIES: DUF1398 family protein [unclassified Lactobacillus]AVK61362.1 hypothetical protein C5Z25_06080 [Lactobacillus sp. CBA3605]AVK63944.1 hypothetical protein C5Z26_07405 [Lactobacillus sp. CBA3606]
MFKLAAIDKVLAELGEHVDFATIGQKEADLGVQHFQYDVATGATTYFGEDGYLVERRTNGLATRVAREESAATVTQVGTDYVAGKLDLATAVKQLAAAGCQAWTANLKRNVINFSGDEGKILATIKF